MVVFGLLGLLCRFSSLSPPFISCFSDQISVTMAIRCVSTTAPFSPLLESVVSADSVILIVITVILLMSGKNKLRPRVVFITLSMGWCVFASILGVSMSKVEWRYEYRTFIFLLVMEENRLRILIKTALRIAEDMKLFEDQDCMFHMVLMEETQGFWKYMLSMAAKKEEGTLMTVFMLTPIHNTVFRQGQRIWWRVINFYLFSRIWIGMSRTKERAKVSCFFLLPSQRYHYVVYYTYELQIDTLSSKRFAKIKFSHVMLYSNRLREKSNLKLENSSSSERKASSNSTVFFLVYGTYNCVCKLFVLLYNIFVTITVIMV